MDSCGGLQVNGDLPLVHIGRMREDNELSVGNDRAPLLGLPEVLVDDAYVQVLHVVVGPAQTKMDIREL